mmetsp:Transcript_26786/g.39637  ORF Transcript_26786/g.39637 Transcript_26786/m.39637 type:complete len:84 (-) Transcript_26786:133-384(-)
MTMTTSHQTRMETEATQLVISSERIRYDGFALPFVPIPRCYHPDVKTDYYDFADDVSLLSNYVDAGRKKDDYIQKDDGSVPPR